MKKIAQHKVSEILNRAVDGGGVHSIEKDTKVNRSTVWEILKDFPLWDYVRKPDKYRIDNQ